MMLNSFYFNKTQKQVVNKLNLQYTRNISKMGAPSKLLFKSVVFLLCILPRFLLSAERIQPAPPAPSHVPALPSATTGQFGREVSSGRLCGQWNKNYFDSAFQVDLVVVGWLERNRLLQRNHNY